MQGRRRFLRQALPPSPPARVAGAAPASLRHGDDFDALWRALEEGYAYFEKGQDWRSARTRWRPRAVAARTREELLAALEGAMPS